MLILAKSEDGFKFIMVDKDNPGVTISQTTSLDQTRPMAEIILENVEVGNENFMFDIQEDENTWNKVKHISISFLAMEQVGGAQACLDMSTQYAKRKNSILEDQLDLSKQYNICVQICFFKSKVQNLLPTVL